MQRFKHRDYTGGLWESKRGIAGRLVDLPESPPLASSFPARTSNAHSDSGHVRYEAVSRLRSAIDLIMMMDLIDCIANIIFKFIMLFVVYITISVVSPIVSATYTIVSFIINIFASIVSIYFTFVILFTMAFYAMVFICNLSSSINNATTAARTVLIENAKSRPIQRPRGTYT